MDKPPQPPEGLLIEHHVKVEMKTSFRKAAEHVGISDARLRQIANGYSSHGQGQYLQVVASPDRLAQIADALGISADDLRAAKRGDAANILEARQTSNETVSVGAADKSEPEFEFLTRVREDLTTEQMEQLMAEATPYLEMLVRDIKNRKREQN